VFQSDKTGKLMKQLAIITTVKFLYKFLVILVRVRGFEPPRGKPPLAPEASASAVPPHPHVMKLRLSILTQKLACSQNRLK
jgi:hypothetical protein